MKYFKILKNFYNSPTKFPDPEEVRNHIKSQDPIILAQHTRSCVFNFWVPQQWKSPQIFLKFPENFLKFSGNFIYRYYIYRKIGMHNCEYCNSSFSNKYILNRHIDTSKTCIKNRVGGDRISNRFRCGCGYSTDRNDNLAVHSVTCIFTMGVDKTKIIAAQAETIAKLEAQIDKLEAQIDKLISRPINVTQHNNNSTNNNTNHNTYNGKFYNQYVLDNFEALTPTFLQGIMEQMNLVDISHGGTGLAKFAKKHLHHQHLLMLDQARRKGLYKDANGEAKHDSELRDLLTIIGQTAFPPANILFTEWSVANKEDCFLNEEKSGKLTRLLDVVGWLKRVGDGIIHNQDSDTQAQFLGEFVAGFSKEALHNCLERRTEPPLDVPEYTPEAEPEDHCKDEPEDRPEDDSDSSEWPEVSEVDSDEDGDMMDIVSIGSSEFDIDLGILSYETERNKGVVDDRNYWIEYKSRSKFA
jgi:hypothetical protein